MASLRIKEVCKQKGITMGQIAERLGISPVNLSSSLNGNPTLNRLQEVADILEVEIWQLFNRKEDIQGVIQYNGRIYAIDSFNSFFTLAENIKQENDKD